MPINQLIARGVGTQFPGFDVGRAQNNTLTNQRLGLGNQLLQQQVKAQPAQQQLSEQAMQLKGLALDIQAKALKASTAGNIQLDYPEHGFSIKGPRDAIAVTAGKASEFPDQMNDPNFMSWLASQGVSVEQLKPDTAKTIKTWVGPKGKTIHLPSNVPPPKGYVPYSSGMDIEVGPEGTRIRTGVGPGAAGGVSRKTQGTIEQKILNANEALVRVTNIMARWRPEFSEIGERLGATWTSIKSRLGRDVSEDDAKFLTEFKDWQRTSIENINLYIKELTGAQMSEKEANRLRLAQPDPGENWWNGDDPITFQARAKGTLRSAALAKARWNWYRSKGIDPEAISAMVKDNKAMNLDAMREVMVNASYEFESVLRSQGVPEAELKEAVKGRLKQTFGL